MMLYADPGTVVRYRPPYDQDVDVMWCREGMAVARERDGLLVDTFWLSADDWTAKHVDPSWFESVEVLGHLADYRPVARGEDVSQYHPNDRLTVTHQHRLQATEYLRHGAAPDYVTRVRAQVAQVRAAREELRSARWAVEWRERDLQRLLDERTGVPA